LGVETEREEQKMRESFSVAVDQWFEHVEADTGKKFYYNLKTGVSTWRRPTTIRKKKQQHLLKPKPDGT